ncbi:MAG: ABC transporter ATP-binding protein [Cycloclasticus sp.]|nr:ABC transporter ATP-binding protein [Cycloclasticus sp.]MBQ0789977.1 ABC transporter ATP-binding protein [Cycloclasticus sp.]
MNALEIKQLGKRYGNDFVALKGIDLQVKQGDFFALLGANGAGKSTTIGIIASLVNKTSGTVTVFGHDLDQEPEAVKRCIGLVPQEFNFNQFENVFDIVVSQAGYYGIPRKKALERAETCLKQLELWDKRNEASRELSGGMKRRLMIARALVHEPKLLILDEPTAGVDIEIRRSMWAFFKKINAAGTTIILTTHYLEEAESLCRHIAIIHKGEVIENTDMKGLLDRADEEMFVLSLDKPVEVVPIIDGCTISVIDDTTWQVSVQRQAGIHALIVGLDRLGVRVSGLRNQSNRLEQLFLKLMAGKKES